MPQAARENTSNNSSTQLNQAARGLLLQLLSTALVLYFEQLIAVGVQTTAANERCAYRHSSVKTKFFFHDDSTKQSSSISHFPARIPSRSRSKRIQMEGATTRPASASSECKLESEAAHAQGGHLVHLHWTTPSLLPNQAQASRRRRCERMRQGGWEARATGAQH
jgi:hypothetical protein